MADVVSEEKRKEIMSKVRSSGNRSTELLLITLFKNAKITGWRRNYRVKGHPDFVFIPERIAIFVDGCFWHGHNCRNTRPQSNVQYWEKKRNRNIVHDRDVNLLFQNRGWKVIRIWECELKKEQRADTVSRIQLAVFEARANIKT